MKTTVLLVTVLCLLHSFVYGQHTRSLFVNSVNVNGDSKTGCNLSLSQGGKRLLHVNRVDTMKQFTFQLDSITDITFEFPNDTILISNAYPYFLDSVVYNWNITPNKNAECLLIEYNLNLKESITAIKPYKRGVNLYTCQEAKSVVFSIDDYYKIRNKVSSYRKLK